MMKNEIPMEIQRQLAKACILIKHHFGSTLLGIYLYGSTLDGGLKPCSDLDLFVAIKERPTEKLRQALLIDLLAVSLPPGKNPSLRALEVTVVNYNDLVPWKFPPRRELQFGEWLRKDILIGVFEEPTIDPDLTILLAKVRENSIAIAGPPAQELFDPIPKADFLQAQAETLNLWNAPEDWMGEECNIILTLARIWYSVTTDKITSKEYAVNWLLEQKHLPTKYHPILCAARQVYCGLSQDTLASYSEQTAEFILFAKSTLQDLLYKQGITL